MESLYNDEMSKWYDLYSHDENMKLHLNFIADEFRRHNVKTFIDVSCGTGKYIINLHKMGFRGVGIDLSPAMITEARKRSKNTNIKFHVQDMREMNVKGVYDAIILPYSGFSYITSGKDAIKTLRIFRKHLRKGGIIIIDTIYSKEIAEKESDVETVISGNMKYKIISEYYTRKNFLLIKCLHRRYIKGKALPDVRDKKYVRLRLYNPSSIEKILAETGFKTLSFYGSYKKGKFFKSSKRLVTLAKAV